MTRRFFGRDAELEVLQARVRQAHGECEPQVVLIEGDPGSGKSRLLAEAAERSGIDPRISITAYESEKSVPLAAAVEAIRRLGLSVTEISRSTEPSREPSTGLEAVRMFEAVHRSLNFNEALLLMIDDLQWVDETSLNLVHYLIRAAQSDGWPLVAFVASRPSEEASAFAHSIEHVLGKDPLQEVSLGPLDAAGGADLALAANPDLSPDDAVRIYEKASGSPFWIELLAEKAGNDPQVTAGDRLRTIHGDAASVCAALAVASRPMNEGALARILDWPIERLKDAIKIASTRGVIVERPRGFSIAHDLIREAALNELPVSSQKQLHRAMFSYLSETAADDLSALLECMAHAEIAGIPVDSVLDRVLSSPQRRLIGREVLGHLIETFDSIDFNASLESNSRIVDLALELGENETARQLAWKLLRRLRDSDELRGHIALLAARAAYRLGSMTDLNEALDLATSDDLTLEISRKSLESASRHWLQGDIDAGAEAAKEALRMARDAASNDPRGLTDKLRRSYVEALKVAFDTAVILGNDGEAEALVNERLGISSAWEEEFMDAEMTLGSHLRRQGRMLDAESVLKRVWERAKAKYYPTLMMSVGFRLASVLLALGRIDEAAEIASESESVGERIGGLEATTAWFWADWFGVGIHRGRHHEEIESALARAKAIENPHYRSGLLTFAARWLARIEPDTRSSDVASLVHSISDDIGRARCRRCAQEFKFTGAELLARIGNREEAKQWIGGWEAVVPERTPKVEVDAARVSALIEPDPGKSIRLLEESLAEAGRLGMVVEGIWIRLDMAKALAATDPSATQAIYKKVYETAGEIGAVTERGLAEQGLRALGVRTWTRSASAPTQLTSREKEVAGLVARGLSNPEIARRLFLSRKTVERHVSNIFAKLDLRNRAELAAKVSAGEMGELPD